MARDMSCMDSMSVDECRAFVQELAEVGLVSQEHLEELRKVTISRLRKDAYSYAEGVATKKLGAWKTNKRKMFG